jgi:histidyl-tRNA synthetase
MNQNELAFPFRRYQMQPVWRADRPQKGRYREFWQCDADVVGSNSLINEAELLCIYQGAFHELKIPIKVKLNSRKLLTAIAEVCDAPDKVTDITIAMDKLDKIGWQGVAKELFERGIPQTGIDIVEKIIHVAGDNAEKLETYTALFSNSTTGLAGITELRNTLSYYEQLADEDWTGKIVVDISLARGLNYYTGVIVEVVCDSDTVKMGSIGGGGRYDDLTGLFGLKGLSGVGVSFGIDRMYDVMEELNVFPSQLVATSQVLILNYGSAHEKQALTLLKTLRSQNILAEIYPDSQVSDDKQIKYAKKRNISIMVIINEKESFVKHFGNGNKEAFMSVEQGVSAVKKLVG